MAEESESGPPSGPTDEEPSDSEDRRPEGESDAAGDDAGDDSQFDPETDTVYSPDDDDVPGGSIEDYLDDDESVVAADERAPMGATGTADPFDEDERRSVSDAVGAPVSDSELEADPDLELDPSVVAADDDEDGATDDAPRTGREMRDSTAPRHRRVDDEEDTADDESVVDTDADSESVVEADDQSVVEADDQSVVETDDQSVVETDAESPSVDDAETTAPSVDDGETAADLTAADDDAADAIDEGLVGEGPATDEEMPLAAHIEEMVRRLAVVLVVGGIVALAVFPVADQLINFLWNSHIPGASTIADRRPRLYGPLELVVTELKVAALAGFVVGLPIAVYETYLFMRPGLFPRERRYYLAAVPTSLILALIGVAFAHFVVLPAIFAYFTAYTTGTAVVAFGLKETFSLILVLMGYMALVFQIPLFIMLAIMMNLTTRVWLEDRRLLFWGGFLGVAFLISPDPTGMAPIIVAATMITLFEGTLALLRWTGN
ncbi:preprotein translocase subunit TatC [Haloplanus rubicundus]|uniref:Sec-independent protein translocase protein TatC n=1 Tax=Haloplanus rubicundus TaxID=1547898 RepID=A0A345E9A0_9EURY|nr:twin-arginine translocase subunit TatC [Haloplanus rubicundus]AXG08772.1 preprotein translocase subunit TatC [Haloplanus rubicundus]